MEVRLSAKRVGHGYEDMVTGNTLLEAGIAPTHDPRMVVVRSKRSALSGREGCRADNEVIVACEYDEKEMLVAHREWQELSSGKRHIMEFTEFSRIDILVKTFLRDGYLFKCVEGIEPNYDGLIGPAEGTLAAATALNPYLGYDLATDIVKEATKSGRSLRVVAREKGVAEATLSKALDLRKIAKGGIL
jgi:hypothetical protein